MALPNRICFLKTPNVLEPEWSFLNFIFVSNNVSNVGRWNTQHFELYVVDQLPTLGRGGHIDCVLFFDFVILALRRNTPAVKIHDLPRRIEIDMYDAMFSAFGSDDLVSLTHARPDLIFRQHGHVRIGI